MKQGITRRAVLAGIPAGVSAATRISSKKGRALPRAGEFVRFADPATEAVVVRLTAPSTTSLLPASSNRFISNKDKFLIFSSDRTGRATPFHLDLRTGLLKPLVPVDNLLPESLCLDAQERSLYFLDGGALKEVSLAGRRTQTLAEDVSAFSVGTSRSELVVVRRGRLERLDRAGSPFAENVAGWCLLRPGGKGCAFKRKASNSEEEIWYTPLDAASGAKPVLLAKGLISNPIWSPRGQSLLFLRDLPKGPVSFSEIHEVFPESRIERRVAATTQFAAFSVNSDGSVFVGASRSKAQPNVILLLGAVQREFTLCEHRASRAAAVAPVFSPDNRRVYFQSDRQGKSALYSVNVESLVEPAAPAAE